MDQQKTLIPQLTIVKQRLLVVTRLVFVAFGIVLTAYVRPVALNTTSPKLNI